MGEGDEIWLKLVEMELKKADSHPAGPSGIASGEGKLILQATSELRSPEKYVVHENVPAPAPLAPIREVESEDASDESEGIGPLGPHVPPHVCRNGCIAPDEAKLGADLFSLDTVILLGCSCRGTMRGMCKKCILTWFAPRILVHHDMTCDICNTPLNGGVEQVVRAAFADHAGIAIMERTVGEPLLQFHEARHAQIESVEQMLPMQQEDAGVVNHVITPYAAADASEVSVVAQDAPNNPVFAPAAPDSAPDAPGALVQQPNQSFWKRIRRYMCCATPPQAS